MKPDAVEIGPILGMVTRVSTKTPSVQSIAKEEYSAVAIGLKNIPLYPPSKGELCVRRYMDEVFGIATYKGMSIM
jgi:hypothetical protein